MRIQLTLNRTGKQKMLPMDYQYYISAWIYKVLKQADKDFAAFLHEKGYGTSETKLYKLFCFSRLDFGKPKLWKEKKLFEIFNRDISLIISFDVPEVATNFIKGIFMSQDFYLGDKFNGIDFKVTTVSALADPDFKEKMHYKLQTPWVVSYQPDHSKPPKYLKPDEEFFHEYSKKHLVEKFKNTRNQEVLTKNIVFTPNENYKRAGFLIKNGSPQETRVVGNLFDFELTASTQVHQMIWNAGVSEKSSSGFGWLEVKTK